LEGREQTEGDIAGYHCWAEFYLNGPGWVPVDRLGGLEQARKHDYFFGAHDVNRVFFTYGRDIRLSSDQKGDPLNYFIYPYAEINGHQVKNLETHFSFRDVAATPEAAAVLRAIPDADRDSYKALTRNRPVHRP